MRLISTADIREKMTWEKAVTALFRGHQGTRPKVQDILLEDGPFSLFGRGVILPGYGAGLNVLGQSSREKSVRIGQGNIRTGNGTWMKSL